MQTRIPIASSVENNRAISFCNSFLNPKTSSPKLIFGTNGYAQEISRLIDIDGFINDITKNTHFLGKPIYRMESIPENAMVVSAVYVRAQTVSKKLNAFGILNLDYYSFYKYSGLPLPYPMANIQELPEYFQKNRARYDNLYNSLADEESKQTLIDILNFHLSLDLKYLHRHTDRESTQYFENFLLLKEKGETFIDAGGFDGYTSNQFMQYCPSFRSIHIFEPDPSNANSIRSRFAGKINIFVHETGLSDAKKQIRFSSNGSVSQISENGDIEITTARLDDIVPDGFTFMKIDIEGGEKQALLGAEKSIKQHHPRLAICVYHRFDDLLSIPDLVLSMRNDYSLYLRHYSEGAPETVMFFIPRTS